MELHKLACSSLSLHAVPWACMQFLSSSEQLTRISQCLFYLDFGLKNHLPPICWPLCSHSLILVAESGTLSAPLPPLSQRKARDRLISDKIIVVTWLSLTLLPGKILLSATHHLRTTAAQTQIVHGMQLQLMTPSASKVIFFYSARSSRSHFVCMSMGKVV